MSLQIYKRFAWESKLAYAFVTHNIFVKNINFVLSLYAKPERSRRNHTPSLTTTHEHTSPSPALLIWASAAGFTQRSTNTITHKTTATLNTAKMSYFWKNTPLEHHGLRFISQNTRYFSPSDALNRETDSLWRESST